MKARGTGDDAMFSRQRGHDVATIADEFRNNGVILRPAKKGSRVTGWSLTRSMLMRAGSIDQPALYPADHVFGRFHAYTHPRLRLQAAREGSWI